MEKDDEIKGSDNSINFGARLLDTRLGRWFSRDFVVKPDLSPYQFGRNNAIIFVDPDGNDEIIFNVYMEGTGDDAHWVINTYIIEDGKDELIFRVTDQPIEDIDLFYNAIVGTDLYVISPFEKGTGIGNYNSYKATAAKLPLVIGDLGFAVNDFTYLGILLRLDPTALEAYADSKWGSSLQGAVDMANSETFASYVELAEGAGAAVYVVRAGAKVLIRKVGKTIVNPYADVWPTILRTSPDLSKSVKNTNFTQRLRAGYINTIESTNLSQGVYQCNIYSVTIAKNLQGGYRKNLEALLKSYVDEAIGAGAKTIEINGFSARPGFSKELFEKYGFTFQQFEGGFRAVKDL